MNIRKIVSHVFVPLLASLFAFLPVQVTLCQAAETNTATLPVEGKKGSIEKKTAVTPSREPAEDTGKSTEEDDSSLSTGMWVGIGVGAAAVIGVAIAAGGGGGGDDAPAPIVPPTADSLVSPWHAEGNQPGSGRTYSGTYHLYQGGSLGYDLQVSSGEHLVGSGSWRITEYQLQMRTDHGSLYSGNFTPGIYTVIHMNANTGWNLTLTR